jgi:hypothetical protein
LIIESSDAVEQVRFAQCLEGIGALPIRLGDDAHPKALRFERAADDSHAEAGMVHIGIAGNDDDVAAVPPEPLHLGAAHRQEGCRAEARRPIFAVAGDRLCGAREKGNVDRGVHEWLWGTGDFTVQGPKQPPLWVLQCFARGYRSAALACGGRARAPTVH